VIAALSFLIIFFVPVLVEWNDPYFNVNNYEFQTFPLSLGLREGNLTNYLIFRSYQFIVLAIAILLSIFGAYTFAYRLAYGQDTTLYSTKHKKFYQKEASFLYNRYKNDYFDELQKNPDFNMVLDFLCDPQRFAPVKDVETCNFDIFSLEEEDSIIVSFNFHNFLLSPEESDMITTAIKRMFSPPQ